MANGAGTSITCTCTNGSWNLTNIVVYSGWGNYNRDGQFYNITYSTLAATNTFIPLTSVFYNPLPPIGVDGYASPAANRVAISPANGAAKLATNVYAVKFDFTPQTPKLGQWLFRLCGNYIAGNECATAVCGSAAAADARRTHGIGWQPDLDRCRRHAGRSLHLANDDEPVSSDCLDDEQLQHAGWRGRVHELHSDWSRPGQLLPTATAVRSVE